LRGGGREKGERGTGRGEIGERYGTRIEDQGSRTKGQKKGKKHYVSVMGCREGVREG
jgi:hypothetical protein